MKKFMVFVMSLFITILSFANVQHVSAWDKPLVKRTFTSPNIVGVAVWKDHYSGNLIIDIDLDDWTDDRTWRAVVGVRTYARFWFNYQWYTIFYNVDFTTPLMSYAEAFSINQLWQYTGYESGANTLVLNPDQYFVSSWGPL